MKTQMKTTFCTTFGRICKVYFNRMTVLNPKHALNLTAHLRSSGIAPNSSLVKVVKNPYESA